MRMTKTYRVLLGFIGRASPSEKKVLNDFFFLCRCCCCWCCTPSTYKTSGSARGRTLPVIGVCIFFELLEGSLFRFCQLIEVATWILFLFSFFLSRLAGVIFSFSHFRSRSRSDVRRSAEDGAARARRRRRRLSRRLDRLHPSRQPFWPFHFLQHRHHRRQHHHIHHHHHHHHQHHHQTPRFLSFRDLSFKGRLVFPDSVADQ